MPNRLLILGVDAASPELIRGWAGEGKLPTFRRWLEQGASGAVRGVPGFYIGSTWPSFCSGLNPARHGFYRIEQLECGRYGFFRPLDSPSGVGGAPFWKLASGAGRRVAVLDVPLTRLDASLNGVQTVEWGGHDCVFGFQAFPPALHDEVLSLVGPYPVPSDCDADRRSAEDFERFVSSLERAVEGKAKLTRALLSRERWDLLVQVFTEAHCAGHQCWHLHDPSHPSHDPAVAAALGDPLERIYRAVDRALASIVAEAGDDTHVLIVSAHGMGGYRGANFLLPEILFRLGATARPAARAPAASGGARSAARAIWGALPGFARAALDPLRRRLSPAAPAPPPPARIAADPARSRCFPIPNGSPVSGIRLNLAGREPQGLLRPGAEADAFCRALARDLLAVTDERTGSPLARAVHRTADLYQGERLDALPDLLVEWSDAPVGTTAHAGGRGATIRARSEAIGTVEASNRYGRTGEHLPTGLFLWRGPGVATGEREPVSVMDFHPTICRLLGVSAPAVDGRPVPGIG